MYLAREPEQLLLHQTSCKLLQLLMPHQNYTYGLKSVALFVRDFFPFLNTWFLLFLKYMLIAELHPSI